MKAQTPYICGACQAGRFNQSRMKDFFQQIEARRAEAIARLDAETFAPLIRNHLVQLFRKAQAKDKGLTGVLVGMGAAIPNGEYLSTGDASPDAHHDDKAPHLYDAGNWDADQYDMLQPMHAETHAFLSAVREYDRVLASAVPCDDITVADLETTRAKKSRAFVLAWPR